MSQETYPNKTDKGACSLEKRAIPFSHRELRKSLEEIVEDTNAMPKKTYLEDMFSDKAKTLKSSVNALLEEVKLRQDLNFRQFKEMNGEICRQHTELMNLENIRDCYPGDLTRDVDEAKARIKTNVLEPPNEKDSKGAYPLGDIIYNKKKLHTLYLKPDDFLKQIGIFAITGELIYRAFIFMGFIHQNLKSTIHDLEDLFRIEFFGH